VVEKKMKGGKSGERWMMMKRDDALALFVQNVRIGGRKAAVSVGAEQEQAIGRRAAAGAVVDGIMHANHIDLASDVCHRVRCQTGQHEDARRRYTTAG
jgi:hypothetical protein